MLNGLYDLLLKEVEIIGQTDRGKAISKEYEENGCINFEILMNNEYLNSECPLL